MQLTIRNFTGTSLNLDVNPTDKISDVKRAISNLRVKRPGTAFEVSRIRLEYKGHILRDDRPLQHYNIPNRSVVNIAPPSKNEQFITVEFVLDWIDDARFSIVVNAGSTVAKLKEEISIEENIKVSQLKTLSEGTHRNDRDDEDDDDDNDMVLPVLVELQDDRPIAEYCLEGKIVTVYTQLTKIIVKTPVLDEEKQLTIHPTEPISKIRKLLESSWSGSQTLLRASCLAYRDAILEDETRTCVDFSITSGAILTFDLPPEFAISLNHHDRAARMAMTVKSSSTLREFREAVSKETAIDISQLVLLLMGKELKTSDDDRTLAAMDVFPDCIVHVERYINLEIITEIQSDFNFAPLPPLHPLTRFSQIRALLEKQIDPKDLNKYKFTLVDHETIKEDRRLWDLGVISGFTIFLRPREIILKFEVFIKHGPFQAILSPDLPKNIDLHKSQELWIEIDEDVLCSKIDSQVRELLANDVRQLRTHMVYRKYDRKPLERNKTLKECGVTGGETFLVFARQLSISEHNNIASADDNDHPRVRNGLSGVFTANEDENTAEDDETLISQEDLYRILQDLHSSESGCSNIGQGQPDTITGTGYGEPMEEVYHDDSYHQDSSTEPSSLPLDTLEATNSNLPPLDDLYIDLNTETQHNALIASNIESRNQAVSAIYDNFGNPLNPSPNEQTHQAAMTSAPQESSGEGSMTATKTSNSACDTSSTDDDLDSEWCDIADDSRI